MSAVSAPPLLDRDGTGLSRRPAGRLTAQAVSRAIAALPAHHRTVVLLRDVEGLSYGEMAQALGCSLAAVKVRLHRARQVLRQALRPLLEEER